MSMKSFNTLPIIVKRKIVKKQPPLIRITQPLYKEDVLYDANSDSYLGEGRVRIVNKLNRFTNTSRTIAKCETKSGVIEKTSDNITKLIGQRHYDLLISALCSVLSHELKIRGIYSLLTPPRKTSESSTQTDSCPTLKKYANTPSQTDETVINLPPKRRRKKIKRQVLTPYVISDNKDDIKKVVINPCEFKAISERRSSYEDCKEYFEDNSNDSIGKLSSFSIETTHSLLHNPASILTNVDKYTKCTSAEPIVIHNTNSTLQSNIQVSLPSVEMAPLSVEPPQTFDPVNAKVKYHEFFNTNEQKHMLVKNALEEWKCSNMQDEDGNLPLHVAVMEKNANRVKMQCLALKSRKISLDSPGNEKWTALKMALNQNSTKITEILLSHGADPLLEDEDERNSIHLAAESPANHLNVIINFCRENARSLLEDYNLWTPECQTKSAYELSEILLNIICNATDNQGYTPLMLASKLGHERNVRTLLEIAPRTVNKPMPTCGNTALYLAVDAAYADSANRCNKSHVSENYRKTIETLVERGADPAIDNHSGTDVNDLLTEFNIAEMSMLVANKLTCVNFFNGSMPESTKNFNNYMVIKTEDDEFHITDINETKVVRKQVPVAIENKIPHRTMRTYPSAVDAKQKNPTSISIKNTPGTRNLVIVKGADVKNVKLEINKRGLKRKVTVTESPGDGKFKKN